MKATLLEIIMMGVDGVLGARTTAGAGMYTNSGGAMIVEGVEVAGKVWGKGLEKMKWKSFNRKRIRVK